MRRKLIRLLIVLMVGVVSAPLPAAAAQPPQLGEALPVACKADVTGDPIIQVKHATTHGYLDMRGMKVLCETIWLEQ
jgi:hypothetical protein